MNVFGQWEKPTVSQRICKFHKGRSQAWVSNPQPSHSECTHYLESWNLKRRGTPYHCFWHIVTSTISVCGKTLSWCSHILWYSKFFANYFENITFKLHLKKPGRLCFLKHNQSARDIIYNTRRKARSLFHYDHRLVSVCHHCVVGIRWHCISFHLHSRLPMAGDQTVCQEYRHTGSCSLHIQQMTTHRRHYLM